MRNALKTASAALAVWSIAAIGTARQEQLTFALVPKLLDNPVFNYARLGAEKKARQLGNIKILWRAPQEADAARQVEIIESLVSLKVDGIAVSCNEPNALKFAIDKAVQAGIPVITFDSDSPDSLRATYYGIDDAKCGGILGRELARVTGGKGQVAMMTGMRGAYNLQQRMEGVHQALGSFPDIKIVQIVACDDDIAKAVTLIETTRRARPDLAGWIFVGGWPLFARGALDGLNPKRVKVVSWDALPPQWGYLESGQVEVLLAQRVFHWGAESVDLLKRAAAGEKLAPYSYAGVDLVTRNNLAKYKRMWASWENPDQRLINYPLLRP